MTEKKDKVEVLEPVKGSVEARPEDSFLTIFQVSVEKGYEPAFIEKMMELQERNDANNAKKAYVKAMAEFKKDPPAIYKDKENSQFKSKYSSIDSLVNSAIPFLSRNGLSHSWQIGILESGWPSVTCILTHELGHSDSVTMSAPPDTSGGGSKNPIQQMKSTQTYLKIATFEAVTGLVSREANLDDDGNGAGSEPVYITEDQVAELKKERELRKVDGNMVLAHFEIKSIEQLPIKRFTEALALIKARPIPKKEREPGEDG